MQEDPVVVDRTVSDSDKQKPSFWS